MKRHSRTQIESKAEVQLIENICQIQTEFKLTEPEFCRVITTVFTNQLQSVFRYQLRMERRGNTETPADREKET